MKNCNMIYIVQLLLVMFCALQIVQTKECKTFQDCGRVSICINRNCTVVCGLVLEHLCNKENKTCVAEENFPYYKCSENIITTNKINISVKETTVTLTASNVHGKNQTTIVEPPVSNVHGKNQTTIVEPPVSSGDGTDEETTVTLTASNGHGKNQTTTVEPPVSSGDRTDEETTVTPTANNGEGKDEHSVTTTDSGSSKFPVVFMLTVVFVVGGYFLYHNRSKVLGLIIEGKDSSRGRRSSPGYQKLRNLEEAMPGMRKHVA